MAINKVGSKGIVDCSVATADFAPGTVSSGKFVNSTIANAKLSNSSVTVAGQSIALGASGNVNNQFVEWQSKITSDGSTVTTMVAGRGYFVDNSSAAGFVKLPASASIGDTISIKDYAASFGTNKLTIQRNSHKIQGATEDSEISTARASVRLVYADATKGWLYEEESNISVLGPTYIEATGGTVSTSGNFKIHSFTGDGNFVISTLGNNLAGTAGNHVDYMVVAGGGGAGVQTPGQPDTRRAGGGGGAGGFREGRVSSPDYTASPLVAPAGLPVSAQTYPVTVGGGGAGAPNCSSTGARGSNSVFSTITSTGGGGGKTSGAPTPNNNDNSPGGSGAGGANTPSAYLAGSGNTPPFSPSQGTNGGIGNGPGGAGGGATSAGAGGGGATTEPGSTGGTGATTHITGSPVAYSGGGSGQGGNGAPTGGTGGTGGGGPSGSNLGNGTAGTANRGGGGGSGAGAGGKGIVVIRYKFQ